MENDIFTRKNAWNNRFVIYSDPVDKVVNPVTHKRVVVGLYPGMYQ